MMHEAEPADSEGLVVIIVVGFCQPSAHLAGKSFQTPVPDSVSHSLLSTPLLRVTLLPCVTVLLHVAGILSAELVGVWALVGAARSTARHTAASLDYVEVMSGRPMRVSKVNTRGVLMSHTNHEITSFAVRISWYRAIHAARSTDMRWRWR